MLNSCGSDTLDCFSNHLIDKFTCIGSSIKVIFLYREADNKNNGAFIIHYKIIELASILTHGICYVAYFFMKAFLSFCEVTLN